MFDLDGTLVDSEEFIVWTFVEAGRIVGVRVDPRRVSEMIGYPLDTVLEKVLDNSSVDLERFKSVRKRIIEENWRKMIRVFPEVHDTLEYLERKGYVLGVASSSITPRIRMFLEYFGLKSFFKVVSGVEEGVKGKPEPDVILKALRELKLSSSQAVYVGDRFVDCVASSRAGVDFILVDRNGSYDGGWSCTPFYVVKTLADLTRLF